MAFNAGLGAGFVSIASGAPDYSLAPTSETPCFDNQSAPIRPRTGRLRYLPDKPVILW